MATDDMKGTYIERVTKFLSEYLKIPKDMLYPDGNMVESAIPICVKYLIEKGIFTKEEMRKHAMKDYAVILPHSYFAEGGE